MRSDSARVSGFVVASLVLVLLIQVLRFVQLDQAPPGFYVDEATGAAQVLCIKQTGADYFNHPLPAFAPSLGGGFYTPPYLYGQILWTSVFGNSIAAFRSFVALLTTLTILIFALFIRRRVGFHAAIWFAILGSISPWSWQFSRIAWDPPLAPFFLALAIYTFTAGRRWSAVVGGLFFALAAYSYPPTRLQAGVFLLLMPGVTWVETAKAALSFGIALIPLLVRSLESDFTARANLVGIWSEYVANPYRDESILGLVWGVIKNVALHFTPEFLLVRGDANLRHSTQAFGMISYPEAASLGLGLGMGAWAAWRGRLAAALSTAEWSVIWIAGVGMLTGVLPSAMTWESVPHALRSITAWPFFCMLAAVPLARATSTRPLIKWASLASCLVFAVFYLNDYFNDYPARAAAWFQTDPVPFAHAYEQMVERGLSCAELRLGR